MTVEDVFQAFSDFIFAPDLTMAENMGVSQECELWTQIEYAYRVTIRPDLWSTFRTPRDLANWVVAQQEGK